MAGLEQLKTSLQVTSPEKSESATWQGNWNLGSAAGSASSENSSRLIAETVFARVLRRRASKRRQIVFFNIFDRPHSESFTQQYTAYKKRRCSHKALLSAQETREENSGRTSIT